MLDPDLSRLIGDLYENAADARFDAAANELIRLTQPSGRSGTGSSRAP